MKADIPQKTCLTCHYAYGFRALRGVLGYYCRINDGHTAVCGMRPLVSHHIKVDCEDYEEADE